MLHLKKKKAPRDIINLHLCTENLDDMIYSSWDIECDRLKLVITGHFLPFYPLPPPSHPLSPYIEAQKIWILKRLNKLLEISSFYTSVPKTKIMRVSSWDTEWDRQSFLLFWAIFALLTPLTTRKINSSKKWRKHLGMSSFYTCVPKITIIWCMLSPHDWPWKNKI